MLKNWDWPEVSIRGADQKDRGLWRGECGYFEIRHFAAVNHCYGKGRCERRIS